MLAVLSLFIIIILSILITRVATIALTHTGMSREAARFQARSAFTGAGFTTCEAEMVVNHPLRRRIVMVLMLLGNAGIATAMSSLILTFINRGEGATVSLKVVVLGLGLLGLWWLASSHWIDRHLSRLINRGLDRFTELDITDYASLLHLVGEYRLAELELEEDDWLAGQSLEKARLRGEGVNVLGVHRQDGSYLGNPNGATEMRSGDTLILYGRTNAIRNLDRRRKGMQGDREHREATSEQQDVVRREKARDERSRDGGEEKNGA